MRLLVARAHCKVENCVISQATSSEKICQAVQVGLRRVEIEGVS